MSETYLIPVGSPSSDSSSPPHCLYLVFGSDGAFKIPDQFKSTLSPVLGSLLDCLQLAPDNKNLPGTVCIDLGPNSFNCRNGLIEAIQLAVSTSNELFTLLENGAEGILKGDSDLVKELLLQVIRLKLSGAPAPVFGDTLKQVLKSLPGTDALGVAMLKEAEVSRHLGFCTAPTVSRLSRALTNLGIPTRISSILDLEGLPSTDTTRMSILEEIGKPQSILPISNKFIKDVLQKHVEVIPSGPVFGPVTIPGSKSISNRVLLLAALGKGTCVIKGLLDSDDTQVMLNALERFGASFEWAEGQVLRVTGTGGKFVKCGGEVYLNNAGTASRFLTSTAAFIPSSESSPLILTGNARMKERPIGPLVEALRANGCCIEYMETPGCLPLRVKHTGLQGGMLALQGKVSSQYVSSVLMSAPYARSPMTLHLAEDHPTSLPYITMTLELMKDFGVAVEVEGENRFRIPVGAYTNPTHWTVEPDASSATYFLAMAAMSGGEVKVTNLGSRSLQGDSGFYRVLELMGCAVEQTEEFTRVRRDHSKVLVAFTLNMENMTDAFMTAAVLAAVAEGMSSITGISNQRVKECNRILVMVTELSKLGIPCGELEDGIWVQGVPDTIGKGPSPSVDISCHDDHRIAMSFAVLGSVVPGINITDKECTGKTFPGFWDDCRLQLRIPLNSSRNGLPSICLIGMRACGKSTLGRIAASALGLGFLNMDDVLVRELNMPIETFVLVHGWEAFREAESNLLRNLLKTSKPGTILSCGGGIVELESNVKLLTELNPVVNVQRDFKTVAKFLAEDRSRPNLPDPIDEVWVRREPLYRKCSDYTFTVDGDWETVNFKFIQFVEALLKN